MKCEICHERTAQTAIGEDGNGEELYVCEECAKRERARRQKRRERTRKSQETAAIAQFNGDDPPPFIKSLLGAVTDMVNDLEKIMDAKAKEGGEETAERAMQPLDCAEIDAPYVLRGRLHLEGLHLIGELEAVRRAVDALGLRLDGISLDGIFDTGHAFNFSHPGNSALAKRVLGDILRQERNARIRLVNEMPRVFSDSVCRALAILKNCRLLSEGEYFDLLSPLRLAAISGQLEGISLAKIEKLLASIDIDGDAPRMTPEEKDEADAAFADNANKLFEDVFLKF